MRKIVGAVFACAVALDAGASCGTAFCMVNTNWNVQGVWTEPGLRLDLRFEYIDQDQPRSGRERVGVGEIPQHHDEIRTINRNWLATLDYTFNEAWGVSATLPVIDRNHSHIHNHGGAQLLDQWSFTEAGDVRVLGRRQWRAESAEAQRLDFFGATFGLKLPTGTAGLEVLMLVERRLDQRIGEPRGARGQHAAEVASTSRSVVPLPGCSVRSASKPSGLRTSSLAPGTRLPAY